MDLRKRQGMTGGRATGATARLDGDEVCFEGDEVTGALVGDEVTGALDGDTVMGAAVGDDVPGVGGTGPGPGADLVPTFAEATDSLAKIMIAAEENFMVVDDSGL
eukprot:scaffold26867_cov43-Cyclotella_meneghiniana.AAC.2